MEHSTCTELNYSSHGRKPVSLWDWRRSLSWLSLVAAVIVASGGGNVRDPAVATAYRGTVPIFPDLAEIKKNEAKKELARQCTERQKVFAPPAVIQAKGLTKIFHKHHFFSADEEVVALNDITADLKGPDSIALVGDTGAGKTTFLKCLAGLVQPTAGSITVSGLRKAVYVGAGVHYMTGKPIRKLLRERVAERLLGKNLRNVEIVTDTILGATDLSKNSRTRDKELSGSEVYRFAIAMALAAGCSSPTPPVLILDNTFERTDERVRRAVQWTLYDLQREFGVMLLFTASDYMVVMEIAKQVAAFERGRITEVCVRERSRYAQLAFLDIRMELEYKAKKMKRERERERERESKGGIFNCL